MTRKEYRELLSLATSLEQHHTKHKNYKNCQQCKDYQLLYLELFKVQRKPLPKVIENNQTTIVIPTLVDLIKQARSFATTSR